MNMILRGSGGGSRGSKTPTIEPDSLLSRDVIEFNLALCEGPIAGLVHGPHTFYVGGTPLVSKNGDTNFDSFGLSLYHGDADATKIVNALGGTSSGVSVGVNMATNTPITRQTPPALRNTIDNLEVRLNIQQLFKIEDDGDQREHTAEFAVRYRRSGTSTWKTFTDKPTIKLTGKTTGGYIKELVKTVPRIATDWEIQVELISPDNDTKNIVAAVWESFQVTDTTPRAYDNLAVIRGIGRVTDQMSGNPNFNGVYAAKIVRVPSNFDPLTRHYEGTWDGTFKFAHTDSLVWCIYDLLLNETYGFKRHYPNLKVDRFSAYNLARWCDTLVPRSDGGYQPRFTFNHTFSDQSNALELLYYVAGIAGIIPITDLNGTVRLKGDVPGSVVQVFAPESVKDGIFNYQFTDVSDRINDVTVRFLNPNLGWAPDFRRVKDDASIAKHGRIPQEFEAIGCIDPYEAERRAQRVMLQAITETCTVTFQSARPGMGLELYDLIGISDPDANWGLSGRIQSYNATTITLRDQLMVPPNQDLLMSIQTPSGVREITVRSSTTYTNTLTRVSGTIPADTPARAQFALTSPGVLGLVKPFRILNITPDADNPDLYTITALEHNINKYGDADNLTSTGMVDYSGSMKDIRPLAPVITRAEAGINQQRLKDDGTITSRIYIEWDQDNNVPISEWNVFYRVEGEDSWQVQPVKEQKAYLRQAELDVNYEVQVQAVSWTGKTSVKSESVTTRTSSRIVRPPTPSGWYGVKSINAIVLYPPDIDNFVIPSGYSYRIYGAPNDAAFGASTPLTTSATLPIRIENPTHTRFFVTALDRYKNESNPSAPILVEAAVEVSLDPPGVPMGLTLESSLVADGVARLFASWNMTTGASSYEVAVTESGGNEVLLPAAGISWQHDTLPGTGFSVRVRGISALGRPGPFSEPQTIVAARDTTPPGQVTGLTAQGGIGAVVLKWTARTEPDLSHYEVFQRTTTTAPTAGTAPTFRSASTTAIVGDLLDSTQYYYWVRAVDTSDNKGQWSARASAKTVVVSELIEKQLANATWATELGFIIHHAGPALPATNIGQNISWNGRLYRWDGTKYAPVADVDDITFENLTGSIGIDQLPDGLITAEKIADKTLTAEQIADGALTAEQIADKTLTAEQIADKTLTADQIAGKTLTAEEIADKALTAEQIADGTLTADQIADKTLTAEKLVEKTLTAEQIADKTLTAGQIADGAVTAEQIADKTLTAGQIADGTLTAEQIADKTLTADQIADKALTADQIADKTLTAAQIAEGAVGVDEIAPTLHDLILEQGRTAEGDVQAAAGFAAIASTKASEASQSATSAAGAATLAQTRAGEASTWATQAAQSRNDATGAASDAASSASVSATARNQAVIAANSGPNLPSTFSSALSNWTRSRGGSPEAVPGIPEERGRFVTDDPFLGECFEWTPTPSAGQNIMTRGIVPAANKAYRITVRFRVVSVESGTSVSLNINGAQMLADYSQPNNFFSPNTLFEVGDQVHTHSLVVSGFAGEGVDHVHTSLNNYPFTRFGFRLTESVQAVIRIKSILVEDVTQQVLSATSAKASATSAASASASATEAGQQAVVSTTRANEASTAAGTASTKAQEAASSATNAAGSASNAATSASTAATARDQAQGQATAASESATSASASATQAGQSATTATTRANEASTNAGTASTKAAEAATSATDALGSRNAAATSASTAASARDAAQGHAGAASTSATSAAASADAAGQEATSAQSARTAAETARGQAQTSASSAATSATNALGSQNAAATSASTAASARDAAQGHASAASTSASNAAASATTAGQQAATATTRANEASTSAGTASTKATEAATSASDAAGSATSAATSASTAATARGQAQTAASASSDSATAAAASATTAGQQATAAQSARTAAETARGQAQTHATNAATSETNAAGSASQAASSAGVAASASDVAISAINNSEMPPSRFAAGLHHWTTSREGSPDQAISTSQLTHLSDDEILGVSVRWRPSSHGGNVLSRAVLPYGGGRAYRVTATFRVLDSTSSDGGANIAVQLIGLDANFANPTLSSVAAQVFPADGSVQTISAVYSNVNRPGVTGGNGITEPWVRLGLRNNRRGQTATIIVQSILIEDVTQSIDAANSATASATSAAQAAASNTAAGQEATAAQSARTAAETARGQAQTSATGAATSATNAAGSASSAALSASTAATARDQAGASATAASGSASAASASATTAGQQATTATTRAQEAATSAGTASTKATEAATSATDALGSRNAAATSASTAATARDQAQGHASAASTSASQAAASATTAGQSATTATTRANEANTSAGTASTKATEAASAATTAAGHASDAATSSSTSATALGDVQRALNTAVTLINPLPIPANSAFGTSYSGLADTYPTFPSSSYFTDSEVGPFIRRGNAGTVNLRPLASCQPDSVFRVTARLRVPVPTEVRLVAIFLGADGNSVGSGSYQTQVVDGIATLSMIIGQNSGGIVTQPRAGTTTWNSAIGVRFGAGAVGTPPQHVDVLEIRVEDVTQADLAARQAGLAAGSATAAATSASSASASATSAGQEATAAQTARVNAETARGQAQTSATEAASSATSAAGSASNAATSATTAASARDTAQGHANAASTSAGQAAASATTAGQQATSATQRANEASTSAGTAATRAQEAATSASNAAGSQSSAATSASTAASARDQAQGHAGAASTSASQAAASASAAGQEATSAQTARTQAETARGQAQTHATNAATSATNAAGSASNAATSAGVAASAQGGVIDAINGSTQLPSRFAAGLNHWTSSREGSPTQATSTSRMTFITDEVLGEALRWRPTSVGGNVLTRAVLPYGNGRAYRVTATFRVLDTTASNGEAVLALQLIGLNEIYASPTLVSASITSIPADGSVQTLTAVYSDVSRPGVTATNSALRSGARLGLRNNNAGQNPTVIVQSIQIEDVTQSIDAAISASASSTSATQAAASATSAGQEATAAQNARTAAETARGQAQTHATDASTSATNAQGSASSAATSAGTAATARDQAQTAQGQAAASATTAQTQASNASTSATTATQQATAAQTARTGAETARGQAQTSATNAATSATNAQGSQNAAATSASTAASARDAAQGHASAASTSASQAAASATSAGQQATTATTRANEASTSAGNASTKATEAATSATNAAGSATAAATSASVSASARDAAVNAANSGGQLPSTFTPDLSHWTLNRAGSPQAMPSIPSERGVWADDAIVGPCLVWDPSAQTGQNVMTRGVVPAPGRAYRVTARFRVTSAEGGSVALNLVAAYLNDDFTQPGQFFFPDNTFASGNTVHQVSKVLSSFPGQGVDHVRSSLDTYSNLRFGLRLNENKNAVIRIKSILIEDVTQEVSAANAAVASAESLAQAVASATAAGQEATAAQSARTAAETARGQAQTAASSAATSATNAAGSQNAAATSASTAASARDAAQGHASSAATSATNAAASATTAGEQATTATNRANAASTSAGTASTKAAEAATSATNAAGSASSAATSAGTAATARDQAAASASTAQTQASNASSSATTAAQQATAAQTARTGAETARGQAQTSATSAATSATNAAGSENAAATSASVSAAARDASEAATSAGAVLPSTFVGGLSAWTTNRGGSPLLAPGNNNLELGTDDEIYGHYGRWTPGSTGASLLTRGVLPSNGRIIRITVDFKVTWVSGSGSSVAMGLYVGHLDPAYSESNSFLPIGTYSTGRHTITTTIAGASAPGVDQVLSLMNAGSRPYIRAGLRMNESTSAVIRVGSIRVEDVTSELSAANSASASATSASQAAASSTAAGQSASAAETARTQAQTARSGAESARDTAITARQTAETAASTATTQAGIATTARTNAQSSASAASTSASNAASSASAAGTSASTASNHASTAQSQAGVATTQAGNAASSATSAAGAASSAQSYSQLAALALGGGMAKNPTFVDWTGSWPASTTISTTNGSAAKVVGKYGNAVRLTTTSTSGQGPSINLFHASGHLNGQTNPDRMLVTVEVEPLSGNPQGVAIEAGWTDTSATRWHSLSFGSRLKVGSGIQTFQAILERPASVSGAVSNLTLKFHSSHVGGGGTLSNCSVIVHRFDAQEVMADSYLDQQLKTKASVDGMLSSYLLRLKAGGAIAALELVAADNPTGPASSIRMSADEILLDGTVRTAQLAAASITASKMAVGDFTNAILNNDLKDLDGWELDDGVTLSSASNMTASGSLRIAPGQATSIYGVWGRAPNRISVIPGEEYWVGGYFRGSGSAPVQFTPRIQMWFYRGDGSYIMAIARNLTPVTNVGFNLRDSSITIPAEASFMQIGYGRLGGADLSTHGHGFIEFPFCRRKNTGELIVNGSITATHLIQTEEVLTNTAQIRNAIINEGHVTGTFSASILRAGTALASTLTVSGTALSTTTSRAADPAARINAASTQIDPGKILISGSTTLADWRMGGDTTRINGGVISANTVKANSLEIGSRSITLTGIRFEHNSPSANRVSWTAGSIRYVDDWNNSVSRATSSGNALYTSGILYIYWIKGENVLRTTTTQSTAFGPDNVILATYQGNIALDADYGRTIVDGAEIKTGTVDARTLVKTAALITETAQLGNAVVGTLKIGENAVTVPASQEIMSSNLAGNGGWRTANTVTFTMPEDGRFNATWTGEQAYIQQQNQAVGIRFLLNGVEQRYRLTGSPEGSSGLTTDWLVSQITRNVSAGTHTLRVDWWGGNSNLVLVSRTLTVMGVMR